MKEDSDNPRLNHFVPEKTYLEINDNGYLEFDKVDCVELAKEFGTPLYVMSEKKIRENYQTIYSQFNHEYNMSQIAYAYKANPTMAALRILQEEGALAEVISTGELFLAFSLGYKGQDIIFNGCNKDEKGIKLAIDLGALINVDSFKELEIIEKIAGKMNKKARIGIRINPVVKTGTLNVWETALENSKFGITLEKGINAYKKAQKMNNVKIVGIHTHIGSQVENVKSYKTATARIMDFIHDLKELGIEISVVDLGGGIAVPFRYKDVPPVDEFANAIGNTLKAKIDEHGLENPTLVMEPGGGIIGTTTILLLTVGMIKREESTKKWAMVDGGANINLRATQQWYTYQCFCCNKMKKKEKERINIAGPLCYAGDVLAHKRELPILEKGDIIAFLDCGAYTMAILNRYNSYPLPAAVMLTEKRARVIKRREVFTDLLSGENFL
ncbi:MAG: diaminopimelate decarboxylase [Candidatus Methanofastidiosia archaeon]|jgi:diaminopimelate decarboxylase